VVCARVVCPRVVCPWVVCPRQGPSAELWLCRQRRHAGGNGRRPPRRMCSRL